MIRELVYPAIVLGGLLLAIRLRRRLGPAAGVAITGFAVLAAAYGAGWVWEALVDDWVDGAGYAGGPLPDFPPWLVAVTVVDAVAHAAGLALLVAAVLRGRPST